MRKSFVFRLDPTARQRSALEEMLAAHCELYNAALQERRDAWRMARKSTSANSQMKQLSEIRRIRPDQAVWSFTSQQQTLRRLERSFDGFFRRVKAGEKPGFPRFRSVRRFDSVDFQHGDAVKLVAEHRRLRIQGVGEVKVRLHRPLPEGARLGKLTVKREGSGRRARWVVVLPVEVVAEPLPATGSAVGVDLGVVSFLTTSAGARVENPRHLRASQERLAEAQRAVRRARRGSVRRAKAVEQVGVISRKVKDQRRDFHHKTALALVREHDLIAVEDLRPANLVRRSTPVPDPDRVGVFLPNGSAAKSGLSKSILDAGWSTFLLILSAKAESAGRTVVAVDPANTSRLCPSCGHLDARNRLTQASFRCVSCGHSAHADTVAAINVLRRAGTARRDAASAA